MSIAALIVRPSRRRGDCPPRCLDARRARAGHARLLHGSEVSVEPVRRLTQQAGAAQVAIKTARVETERRGTETAGRGPSGQHVR